MKGRTRHIEEMKSLWKEAKETGKLTKGLRKTLNLWKKHNGICYICGNRIPNPLEEWDKLTIGNYPTRDHFFPKSKGGSRSNKNIKLAHSGCNKQKGDKLPKEYCLEE